MEAETVALQIRAITVKYSSMYEEIKSLRKALVEERQLEVGKDIPLTREDHQIVELRMHTALAVATKTIREEVETINDETKASP